MTFRKFTAIDTVISGDLDDVHFDEQVLSTVCCHHNECKFVMSVRGRAAALLRQLVA